jgi:hypothetical protein
LNPAVALTSLQIYGDLAVRAHHLTREAIPFRVGTSLWIAAIERMAARAVDENPRNISYRDTYAYILHREGRLAHAIEQERIALIGAEGAPNRAQLYTMFLRFLASRRITNPGVANVRREDGDVVIESTIPGAVIFASGPRLSGLVRIILPDGVREARVAVPVGLGDGAIKVWFVDAAGPEPRTSITQISFAPRDAVTFGLP